MRSDDKQKIYKLELHESAMVQVGSAVGEMCVTRVPGGWIYTNARLDCNQMNSIFVPYDNGFYEKEPSHDK